VNDGERPAFPGLVGALVLLALAVGAQYAGAQVWLALLGRTDVVLLSGLANLTGLTAVAALGFWASGRPPRWTPAQGTSPGFWVGLVATAAAATVVLGEVSTLVAWVYPMPAALAALFQSLSAGPWPAALFTLAFVAPVTEEALFRGLLLRGFTRRWGRWPALVLSSALFALFHLNVWQAVPAFVAGLYLGGLFLATGSLWAPVVAHAVFNGLPVALAAAGMVVPGYNAPGTGELAPWPLTAAAAAALAGGLWMTWRWSPLSPEKVSDTLDQ
jgi:membrane protease YdiL (CAAX protease family)